MHDGFTQLIIEGLTEDGRRFRPSDWIERLIDAASVYGADRRTAHTPFAGADRRRNQIQFLEAQILDGTKCLSVDGRLRAANPQAYAYLIDFVRSNRLRCRVVD